MKVVKVAIDKYQCEACGDVKDTRAEAYRCEAGHLLMARIKIGDEVKCAGSFPGKVVQKNDTECKMMLENDRGERTLVSLWSINELNGKEQYSPRLER